MMAEYLPFSGIRVVDFGWVWAGALPGQILADLGAEVIKVESRKRLDFMRWGRPIIGDRPDPDQNHMFHNINRNKLSITVDITHPEGQRLLKELISRSDIVVENFAPGFMARVGLDYESLRAIKPDIIMISMSAAGQTGPLSQIRSYAAIIAALSGLDAMVGYPGGEPIGMQQAYCDPHASLMGALAVVAGLLYRRRTGRGLYIDLSQWEAAVCTIGEAIIDFEMNGRLRGPEGNHEPGIAPCGNYPCREPDTWVSIAVKTDTEWEALVNAMGSPEWGLDPRFATVMGRLANREALDRLVGEWTRQYTRYEVTERLQAAGIAAAPLLDHQARYFDPHFRERGVYVEVEHPILGSEPIYSLPWKADGTRGRLRRAPLLGEHNEYVFCRILGLSKEEFDRLVAEKVIY
ncbi:MAG: carnitine dehydratase [Thermoleophilia bacterium]